MERNIGPITKLVETLEVTDVATLAAFRQELEHLAAFYFADNHLRQDYLLTRATKL